MLLGQKSQGVGDTIRYRITYENWLEEGESLATPVSVVLDPASTGKDATIGSVSITPSNHVIFTVSGGSVNETFTFDVQVHNSRGEIKNDTLAITIVQP